MLLALSPYHLTTREPAAMAAMLLANRVVTLIPTPASMGDAVRVRATAEQAPQFVELIETWRWSSPLWDAELVASAFEGQDAREDVDQIIRAIEDHEDLADLKSMLPRRGRGDDTTQLDAIARDLLRAGPDPAISIPVAAGLDRFAARHNLIAVRASGPSLAQTAEARLGRSRFRCAIPVLTQASADRVLEARAALLGPLEELREAMNEAIEGVRPEAVRQASAAVSDAFELEREHLLRTEDDDTLPKVRADTVIIEGVQLPADAVLRSSIAAARKARRRPAPTGDRPIWFDEAPGEVLALVVRVLGR